MNSPSAQASGQLGLRLGTIRRNARFAIVRFVALHLILNILTRIDRILNNISRYTAPIQHIVASSSSRTLELNHNCTHNNRRYRRTIPGIIIPTCKRTNLQWWSLPRYLCQPTALSGTFGICGCHLAEPLIYKPGPVRRVWR